MAKKVASRPGRRKRKPARLIDKKELLRRVQLSYTTLWAMMRDDRFPRSVKLTDGPSPKVAWVETEIEDWIESRPEQTLLGDDKPASRPRERKGDSRS